MSDTFDGAYLELGKYLTGTNDNGDLVNDEWLGQVVVKLPSPASLSRIGMRDRPDNKALTCVLLRNTSGGTLFGKTIAKLDVSKTTREIFKNAGVVTDSEGASKGLEVMVDPYLPAAGVPVNGIFYGVVRGIVTGKTPGTTGAFNGNIAVGNHLLSTTGGTVANPAAPASYAATLTAQQAITMRALEAKTAATDTSQDILVYIDCRWAM